MNLVGYPQALIHSTPTHPIWTPPALDPLHPTPNRQDPLHDIHWKELRDPVILSKIIHNIEETGVILSMLSSLKVLVSKDDPQTHRGIGVKHTIVTATECISADGKSLFPHII